MAFNIADQTAVLVLVCASCYVCYGFGQPLYDVTELNLVFLSSVPTAN